MAPTVELTAAVEGAKARERLRLERVIASAETALPRRSMSSSYC
jgi:hypothetical protein